MVKNDQVRALRDPEYRTLISDFEHPSGTVDEEELKQIAAAGADQQGITTSSWVCGVVSTIICPTTVCSSECKW